jgi:hypothetical protein
MYDAIADSKASIKDVVRYLVVTQFENQRYTKLEQAGSSSDNRPGIHRLFRDIPFAATGPEAEQMAALSLVKAMAQNHAAEHQQAELGWRDWNLSPSRARIWFIKGGPGQGKSTITQYLCQIQRAALILSDPAIKVAAKLKPTVTEVKEIATASGLWPKSPRIPVAFELKEYAKWIARSEGPSTSILVYLAHLIESATGQKALTGTLKRALCTSRWLIIFDGMDEVPGDIKDAIAHEINYFVDDLLVECNCDAQVVCTSRPQGYSGQFDNLEAADIRLTSLSPSQALECAKPILETDRSPQEGTRLFGILSDALGAQAIREIMTTPLQAHIMAVVVRDGGTPPERKWELYSNFYKVINKREADKSADRPLSALLRGNGKLIKALHNRLGFELHARAEASDGAQSSLDRDALLEIIEDVVNNFQAGDTQNTISTLREATTDRLVLVNTPENSSSVRFDIRPLQEFFAAEYIYESADHNTLAERVRTIASDSHWREVLHFLLSALVENERRSELAEVIQVLSQVDDPPSEETRPMSRRLALGGRAVARLLQEGVLEEDQRTRQNFKGCFLPVLSTTDLWRELLRIDRPHSREWAKDVCAEVIRSQVESENIGASAAAIRMLDDNSRHAQEVEMFFVQASVAYRSCIFEMLASDVRPTRRPLDWSGWSASVVLKSLLGTEWARHGERALSSAYSLLDDDRTREAASRLGLSEYSSGVVRAIFRGFSYGEGRRMFKDETHYGPVTVSLADVPDELSAGSWPSGTYEELRASGGLLCTAATVLQAASMASEGTDFLRRELSDRISELGLLPPQVVVFLNQALSERTLPSAQELLRVKNAGRLESFMLRHGEQEPWDWVGFAQDHPDVALDLLIINANKESRLRGSRFIEDKAGMARLLLDLLKEDPHRVVRLSPAWGYMIDILPEYESDLRNTFYAAAGDTEATRRYNQEGMVPLELKLPEEAVLLPCLAWPLFNEVLNNRPDQSRSGPRRSNGTKGIEETAETALACGMDLESLKSVSENTQESSAVRAAALALMYLVGGMPPLKIEHLRALGGYYHETRLDWLLLAIALLVNDAVEEEVVDIVAELSKTLSDARSDYGNRLVIDPLVHRWREVTRTPVLNSSPSIWK